MFQFSDVVSAYKNLLKEKEALNASIKVLTSPQQEQSPKIPSTNNKKKQNPEQDVSTGNKANVHSPVTERNHEKNNENKGLVSAETCDHPLKESSEPPQGAQNENEKEKNGEIKNEKSNELNEKEDGKVDGDDSEEDKSDSNDEIRFLKEKVATLSSTLQTVMEQKGIMETNYQADKKKMMQDFEAKQKDMQQERDILEKKLNELENQLKEVIVQNNTNTSVKKTPHYHH